MTAKKFAPQSPSEIVRIVARMAIAFAAPVLLCQGSFIFRCLEKASLEMRLR